LDNFTATLLPKTYKFVPNNSGLSGVVAGGRHNSFVGRRKQFFIEIPEKTWSVFDQGYLKMYRDKLANTQQPERHKLHTRLDELFDNIQCLPDSTSRSLWRQQEGHIIIQTNPRYYRLKTISPDIQTTTIKATASKSDIIAQVARNHHGINPVMAKRVLKNRNRIQRQGTRRTDKGKGKQVMNNHTDQSKNHDSSDESGADNEYEANPNSEG